MDSQMNKTHQNCMKLEWKTELQTEELKNGRKNGQGIKSKICWPFIVASNLHRLGFNLPWKTNEDFGRIQEQANWGLIGESVDCIGQTRQKPPAYEWQRALQKDDLWFKVQFPKEQFFVKLSRAFGTFPEVQMYLSSGKLRAKASPPCLLLLPYHTACSSCICRTQWWMASCLRCDRESQARSGIATSCSAAEQGWVPRASASSQRCTRRCACHRNRTGSSCASLVFGLSHWG